MKRLVYIIFALTCVACSLEIFPEGEMMDPTLSGTSFQITPAAYVSSTQLPPAATKALIDVSTVAAMEANVLVIDEKRDADGKGLYDFDSWKDAYLSEAAVAAVPSAKSNQYLRSMSLNPVQAYKVGDNGHEYYHTRLISWYPRTCNLYKNDEGKASVMKLKDFNEINNSSIYSESGDIVTLKFKDLDGSKDVMVSNIVEGQYWHVNDGSEVVGGKDRYTFPFGTNASDPAYSNYMTYKHCLSAVKVYATTSNSEQVVSMWGALRKVMVKNQPSGLELTLPSPNSMTDAEIVDNVQKNALEFGSVEFTGNVDFPLIKTAMYGNDNEEVAEDAPSLEPGKEVYLGYALIRPNEDNTSQKLELDIHTDAGVLAVSVPMGEYFKAGYVYKININFNTTGAIAEIVLKSGSEHYYDLSAGTELDGGVHEYQHANCYVIHPEIVREYKNGNPVYYDGYAFDATKVGSATSKIYSSFYVSDRSTDLIEPVRAGLLWESSEGLITQVEYLYGYVRFKVHPPGSENYKEGNAVIAAYDSQRKVLWSWHIWVTDKPQQVTYTIGGKDIVMLDRNLGATAATTNDGELIETYGLYYQWGRKDPSMGPPSDNYRPQSTATSKYYDFYGSMWNYAGVVTVDRPGIRDGVENPMFLVLPSDFSMTTYQYDWMYTNIDNLWGDHNQKTIYDPCPYGYMVPQDEISTLFASTSPKPTLVTGGYKINNSFFPFAGYKGVDTGVSSLSGAWRYVGEKGDYMSSKIEGNGHRSRTYISSTSSWVEYGADADNDGDGDASRTYASNILTDDMTNRRTAASIRCVKIDRSLSSTLFATFVGNRTYAFVGDGEVEFDYSVRTNGENVSIKSVYVDTTIYKTTKIESDLVGDTGLTEVSSKVSYAIPQYVGTGLVRYRLVSESTDGVVSRVAHALRLFAIPSLEVSVKDKNEYTSISDKDLICSYSQSYDVRFTLRGIETDFSVVVNGVLATKNSGAGGVAADPAGEPQCVNMEYAASGINIPGHVHVQILDAEGQLACEKSYDVEMEAAPASYTRAENPVSNATNLQGGGLYFIRTYGTYYNYYLKYSDGKLIWVEYDGGNLTITSDMVFRYHRDDTQGGGVSASYPQSAGAWLSPAAQAGENYLQQDFTFGPEATAVYTTCATQLQSTVLYLGNTGNYFYFDTYNNPNWGSLGKYYHYRWDVYEVN